MGISQVGMNMIYTTVPKRHHAKWLPRIHDLRRFSLCNGFTGEEVDESLYSLSFDDDYKLQLNEDKTAGQIHVHSNLWFTFKIKP